MYMYKAYNYAHTYTSTSQTCGALRVGLSHQ